jgi:phosphatidylethanolamine-binding protein (PEBP) family uncharacterized protein
MRHAHKGIMGFALLLVLVLATAGCAGTTDGSSQATADIPKIVLKSPAIPETSLPALYTCDGKDIPPPLEWGAVPAGTGSLILFVIGVVPKPNTQRYSFSIAWAVAGLNPALHKLDPGRLPPGAAVGVASDHKRNYSVCPKRGTSVEYQFELYGLPAGDAVAPQFAALPIFSSLYTGNKASPADAYGAFVASYTRR